MASFQLIGAASGAQRDWLFSHVAESRNAGRSVVVFVPEQYTLQAERDLLSGLRLPGLLNLDVISPTKLKVLVREAAGSSGMRDLDEAGRAMAIHQVLQSCASRLTFYARAGGLYGAVPRMDRTLAELREEGLTPDLLEEMALSARNGFQRAKYQDLGLIWRNYDALLQDRFDDPVISWRDLCLRLPESGLFQGKDLYVYGFDTVRPDLRELLLAAAPLCHSISVLLTMSAPGSPSGRVFRVQRESALRLMAVLEEKGIRCTLDYLKAAPPSPGDPLGFLSSRLFSEDGNTYAEDPSPALTLYAAPTPAGEAMAIVDALLSWKKAGIPWSRMAIALPKDVSASPALLSALRRNGIPFFLSRQEEVSRHGVSRLLSSALTCVSQGPATEPLLDIAACGFGALTREEGAALTSYVQRWGIDRGRWREPFTRGEKEEAQEAEFLRLKLLTPLNHLHDALLRAREAGAAAEAVFLFLREEGIDIQLQERQQRLMAEERYTEAVVDRQIWDLLMNLLDQLHGLLQGHRITLKEVASLVIGALDRATLSSLPESEEGVAIGRIGHMLPGKTEALILPGMNEGVMSARSDSLLTDPERRALEESAGQAIGLDSARMGMIVRSDYVRTMSLPEKRLFVSYCLRDESGSALLPGEPVTELRRLFPALREKGGLAAKNLPFSPDSPVRGARSLA